MSFFDSWWKPSAKALCWIKQGEQRYPGQVLEHAFGKHWDVRYWHETGFVIGQFHEQHLEQRYDDALPYPVFPPNPLYPDWTTIPVPIRPSRAETEWSLEQKRQFDEQMKWLTFYISDETCWRSKEETPWHVVRITQRYSNGMPYHHYHWRHYAEKEEALLIAKLANWMKDDEKALDALFAQSPFDNYLRSCKLEDRARYIGWLNTEFRWKHFCRTRER